MFSYYLIVHAMTLPNKLSLSRIVCAPIFFLLYHIPVWFGTGLVLSFFLCLLCFIWCEVTDLLDGYLARKNNQISEIGKVLDPFADVISRLTYFVCFVSSGIFPVWLFILLLYREMSMTFLRMIVLRNGTAVGASRWGKLKAIFYSIAGGAGLLQTLVNGYSLPAIIERGMGCLSMTIFVLAVAGSVFSFLNYLFTYFKIIKA